MKILYIMSSYNIYGGTPKKTLDLLKSFKEDASLYVYSNAYSEFKYLFEETNANIYEGNYGKNLFFHLKKLLKIIKNNKIDIVQTQFSMGEVLGYLIKLFYPNVKLVVAFVGPFTPNGIKKYVVSKIYKRTDAFVFISDYIKKEKSNQFPILIQKKSVIIFNGTESRMVTDETYPIFKHTSLLDIAGLVDWKNVNILIEAMNIIINKHSIQEVYLYIAGDGPERNNLESKIKEYALGNYVFLLGYQKNIGALLEECDIYVHPAYAEGFGIAVAEAMIASKPIVVARAGALPELIENNNSGLVVDPFDANSWAKAILTLVDDKKYAENLGKKAKQRAEKEFSVERYILNYKNLYKSLMEKQ